MRKCIILLSILLLGLTACGDAKPMDTVRVVKEEEIQEGVYREVECLEHMPEVTEIVPFMPENGYSECFCVNSDTVFYLVDFRDYLLDQETGNNKEFEARYNTQIWACDRESGNSALIYQYDEDWCMNVSDLVCNENFVVWVDNDEEGWRLWAIPLDGSASPEIIAGMKDMDFGSWTITPVISGNKVYWYDSKEGEENVSVYEYDLGSGTLAKIWEGERTAPYKHMPAMNRTFACCEEEEGLYRLRFRNMDTKDKFCLETTIPVVNPVSNEKICVWRTSYSAEKSLYIYDYEADTVERIDVPEDETGREGHIFSYAVLDRMIIVNYRGSWLSNGDRLLCYDTETKTCMELDWVDNDGSLYYTFQDSETMVSLEKRLKRGDFRILEIFYEPGR